MSKLKKQRRMCGLTQHQVSRLTGIPFSRLCYAESDRIRLTAEEMQRIKAVLTQRVEKLVVAVA
jgi:transcriptional regulator with XRE-family HTH domain